MKSLFGIGLAGVGLGAALLMRQRYASHSRAYNTEIAKLERELRNIQQQPEDQAEIQSQQIGNNVTQLQSWSSSNIIAKTLFAPPHSDDDEQTLRRAAEAKLQPLRKTLSMEETENIGEETGDVITPEKLNTSSSPLPLPQDDSEENSDDDETF